MSTLSENKQTLAVFGFTVDTTEHMIAALPIVLNRFDVAHNLRVQTSEYMFYLQVLILRIANQSKVKTTKRKTVKIGR